ncbi:hypothetical protein V7793_05615 [Streptomyces sp. KLMMK]|uniref:hypothetical protein n=1 Tax=Streptomyces sp. KLMMK TaxID=3109353 RepID=UPI003000F2DA
MIDAGEWGTAEVHEVVLDPGRFTLFELGRFGIRAVDATQHCEYLHDRTQQKHQQPLDPHAGIRSRRGRYRH